MKGTNVFKKNPADPTELDNAITDLFESMENVDKDSSEYAKMVEQMNVLYKLKEVDHKTNNQLEWAKIWIPSAASILGIVAIVGHERANVVTSKALQFVEKLR